MFTNLVVKFALWLYTRKHLKTESYIIGYKIVPEYNSKSIDD